MPKGLGPPAEAVDEVDDVEFDVTAEYGVAGVQGVTGVDGHFRAPGSRRWL